MERVVVVTGAGQGIGEAAAHRFAANGDRLVLTDLTDTARGTAERIAAARPDSGAVATVTDVSDAAACEALMELAIERHGRLDVLVHATAVGHPRVPATELDPADWDRVMAVNARGAFLLAGSAIRRMTRPGGRVVFTGSYTGQIGRALAAGYSASKGALRAFTHSLALEVAAEGITVNGVAPAAVEAALNRQALEADAERTGRPIEELAAERDAAIPVRRQASAAEIADAMFYLASPEAAYVTGTWLDINGGVQLR